MNNNKLQILNLALLLTVGGAASGEELAFLGTSNAVVRDFTGSGVFTQFQVPSGGFGLSIRKFDFEVPSEIPRDERSLVSFNVLALNMRTFSEPTWTSASRAIQVHRSGLAFLGTTAMACCRSLMRLGRPGCWRRTSRLNWGLGGILLSWILRRSIC